MGDQGGEQRAIGIRAAWLVAGERPEGAGETAAPVDIQQDIFKPDPGHAALDQPTQGPQFGSDDKRIGAAQTEFTLIDAGEAVSRQPLGEGRRGAANLARQLREMLCRPVRQAEIGIAGRAGARPKLLVQYQRPEPGVLTTMGKVEVTGSQCVTDGHCQCGFPERAPKLTAIVTERLLPARGNEIRRDIVRQRLDRSSIEAADYSSATSRSSRPVSDTKGSDQNAGSDLRRSG